jgi:hypothetical protein
MIGFRETGTGEDIPILAMLVNAVNAVNAGHSGMGISYGDSIGQYEVTPETPK